MHLCIHMCVDNGFNVEDYPLGVIQLVFETRSLTQICCLSTNQEWPPRGAQCLPLLSSSDLGLQVYIAMLGFLNLDLAIEFCSLKLGSDLIPH